MSGLDDRELIRTIQALYKLSPSNRDFLDARFGFHEIAISGYRKTIDECMYPDTRRGWSVRVGDAQRAMRHYQQASGDLVGTTELMIYGVERAIEFCSDHAYVEDALQKLLLGLYARAISGVHEFPESRKEDFRKRFAKIVDDTMAYDTVFSEALWEIYDEAFYIDPS